MPFDSSRLLALVDGGDFTLWHYRTQDTRAAVLAANYFGDARSLKSGDIILLHAADGMQFLPVRVGGAVGNGLILDTSTTRQNFVREAEADFEFTAAVTLTVRSLRLDGVPTPLSQGNALDAAASVTGPIASLRFTILDSAKTVVSGPAVSTVANGRATARLTLPAAGTGYVLRVEDATDPSLFDLSPSFSVSIPTTSRPALLSETGVSLLSEGRARLVL